MSGVCREGWRAKIGCGALGLWKGCCAVGVCGVAVVVVGDVLRV